MYRIKNGTTGQFMTSQNATTPRGEFSGPITSDNAVDAKTFAIAEEAGTHIDELAQYDEFPDGENKWVVEQVPEVTTEP